MSQNDDSNYESDSVENTSDEINEQCDCCAKSWTEIPNAFGICHCWCDTCGDELKICKYNCSESVENMTGDFKTELKALFSKGESVVFPDDDEAKNEDFIYIDFFKNKNIVCIINCEFDPEYIEGIHLHYDINYWGSTQFNDLLNKYKYRLEWEDNCLARVYVSN